MTTLTLAYKFISYLYYGTPYEMLYLLYHQIDNIVAWSAPQPQLHSDQSGCQFSALEEPTTIKQEE